MTLADVQRSPRPLRRLWHLWNGHGRRGEGRETGSYCYWHAADDGRGFDWIWCQYCHAFWWIGKHD